MALRCHNEVTMTQRPTLRAKFDLNIFEKQLQSLDHLLFFISLKDFHTSEMVIHKGS